MINEHYKNRYEKFIETIKSNKREFCNTEYTETHHIQPRCLKGTDEPANLLELSLREHFLAHWLLWKAYPNYLPLASAFLQMNNKNPKIKNFQGRITSRTYQKLKTEVYDQLKEHTTDKVRIRNESGHLITMTKEEYASQNKYKFHTTGKLYVLDTVIDEWVYISTDTYKNNKDRYKSRMCLDGFPRGNSNGNPYGNPYGNPNIDPFAMKYKFLDTETNEISKISKSEARQKNKEYGYKRLIHIQKKNMLCIDNNGNQYLVPLAEYNTLQHKFYLKGTVNVFDMVDNQQKIISLKEYHLNKNRYLTSTKGKVLAKDQTGKNVLITKNEFDNGPYVGQTKGLRTVFDSQTNSYVQINEEEFLQNRNRYMGPNQGKVNVIDKRTGLRSQIPKNMFDQNIHLSLGSTNYLFKCRNKLTGKEKNINIYEWHLVQDKYEIIDLEKYKKASLLK